MHWSVIYIGLTVSGSGGGLRPRLQFEYVLAVKSKFKGYTV